MHLHGEKTDAGGGCRGHYPPITLYTFPTTWSSATVGGWTSDRVGVDRDPITPAQTS